MSGYYNFMLGCRFFDPSLGGRIAMNIRSPIHLVNAFTTIFFSVAFIFIKSFPLGTYDRILLDEDVIELGSLLN